MEKSKRIPRMNAVSKNDSNNSNRGQCPEEIIISARTAALVIKAAIKEKVAAFFNLKSFRTSASV